MNDSEQFSPDEIRELRTLLEIEKIRSLRLQYSHFMDSRQLPALVGLFAADAICEFGPYGNWSGIEAIAAGFNHEFKETLDQPFWSMHSNTNHQVKLTGPNSAEGTVYLLDIATDRKSDENPFLWFALYDEAYVKIDGQWKVKRTSIHFLWPEKHIDPSFLTR